jgi:hypothetical protein
LLLASPVLRADDKPIQEKKPLSPKEQFSTLVKDFSTEQAKILAELRKLKGEEQQKQVQKYLALGGEYAEKIYKIAEDNPKDPVAVDALFWIMQNDRSSKVRGKASEKVKAVIADMPLDALAKRLKTMFGIGPDIMDVVFERAKKEKKSDEVGDLLGWLVQSGSYYPVGQKAIALLVDQYPEHPAIETACQVLGQGRVENGVEMLNKILEHTKKPKVKGSATLALGQLMAVKVNDLGDNLAEAEKVATEAETYFNKAIDQYGKDFPGIKAAAEQNLKLLHFNRVGLTVPEITAADLDKKEFKLSDYRGKVVLLDFWGNW